MDEASIGDPNKGHDGIASDHNDPELDPDDRTPRGLRSGAVDLWPDLALAPD